ncbi:hypothetical protein OF897_18400 [Chryseobacterium formosus]|uniref:Uncharacterized protein n=1 Tax=Chryseobacterium formosus TaxID=1537363 RepID=A0ABT3XW55_9FLAO|nr:hypothetical protein [Chryseobacterium formosus]MCX8525889.1 hypothetical protein [Chryseobacterium formosus]
MKKVDFSNQKLHRESYYSPMLKEIQLNNEDFEIDIDIRNCFIDYPATPHLIDYFLKHLKSLDISEKKLIINSTSLDNLEHYVLYYLVFESDFFDIREKISSEEELNLWIERINQRLQENNIKLIIKTENKEFNYG